VQVSAECRNHRSGAGASSVNGMVVDKPDREGRVMVGLRVKKDMKAWVEHLAKQEGCDLSAMLRELLRRGLADWQRSHRQVETRPKGGGR
jgi:hypothetical protein